MQTIEFRAMGCHMAATLDAAADAAGRALDAVPGWFEAWEQSLSRFRPDSELSRLNGRAGEWVAVSEALWRVLRTAVWAAEWSGGIVVPTALAALESAGYDRTFEQIGHSRWGSIGPALPAADDWRAIALDEAALAARLAPGLRLDLGGVAKGWAAEQAARRLGEIGPALVDAGGDVCVSGPRADGSPWPISVADPFAPERDLELFGIEAGCVATSGRDYRVWQRGGRTMHHLIDPRTGRPALTDVMSATAIAPTAREAEAAAKTALILGGAEGAAWLNARALAGLLVLDDGRTVSTDALPALRWGAAATQIMG